MFYRVVVFSILCALVFGAVVQSSAAAKSTFNPASRLGGVIADSASWNDWKARFVSAEGRVIDTGNKGISHSEGQGYGMLLAVAADDRQTFDLLWKWTRHHLGPRRDGLFTWRWYPDASSTPERNNATDGDILIAWALGEGADLWRDTSLRDLGGEVASAIARALVLERLGYGTVLLPGTYGFDDQSASDGPVINLSYWIFPAFPRLAQLAPNFDWATLDQTGLRLIVNTTASGVGPADWLSLAGPQPRPARKFTMQSGYDALRVPLYLSLAGRTDPDLLRRFPTHAKGMPIMSLTTGALTDVAEGDGYQAIAGLVRCAVDRASYPSALTAATSNTSYYPATLRLLAQVASLLDPRSCLDATQVAALRPGVWQPVAASLPSGESRPISEQTGSSQMTSSQEAVLHGTLLAALRPREAARQSAVSEIMVGPEDGPAILVLMGVISCGLVGFFVLFLLRRRAEAETLVVPWPDTYRTYVATSLPSTNRELALRGSAVRSSAPLPSKQVADASTTLGPMTSRKTAEGQLINHIKLAAHTSAQWDQYVGVIVFAHNGKAGMAAADIRTALAAVRESLCTADFAGAIGPTEIGICLALLRDRSDLDKAAARLEGALAHAFSTRGRIAPFTSIRSLVHRADESAQCTVAFLRRNASPTDLRDDAPQPDVELISRAPLVEGAKNKDDDIPVSVPGRKRRSPVTRAKSRGPAEAEVNSLRGTHEPNCSKPGSRTRAPRRREPSDTAS